MTTCVYLLSLFAINGAKAEKNLYIILMNLSRIKGPLHCRKLSSLRAHSMRRRCLHLTIQDINLQ